MRISLVEASDCCVEEHLLIEIRLKAQTHRITHVPPQAQPTIIAYQPRAVQSTPITTAPFTTYKTPVPSSANLSPLQASHQHVSGGMNGLSLGGHTLQAAPQVSDGKKKKRKK